MIKSKINVIDLDETLIAYDSFRSLVMMEIRKFDFKIILLTFLRVIRLLNMAEYKEKTTLYLSKKYNADYFKNFAFTLWQNIDSRVLNIVEQNSDEKTINILISASPDIYVKYLIQRLGWEGTGSYFEELKFVHLHGAEKIRFVSDTYDTNVIDYNFAISDSATDDELLKKFQKSKKWTLQ